MWFEVFLFLCPKLVRPGTPNIGFFADYYKIYYYPIGLLNTDTKAGFETYIDGLEQEHMTLLYYSVKESIRTLQNAYYPADLFSASIVTFTDGEDDGSVYYEKYPGDDEDYLQDVNTLLNTEEVAGVPLSAWTIGLQSADASDSKLFLEHLQYLVKAATPSTEEMAV